jgi:hypothetical protein
LTIAIAARRSRSTLLFQNSSGLLIVISMAVGFFIF